MILELECKKKRDLIRKQEMSQRNQYTFDTTQQINRPAAGVFSSRFPDLSHNFMVEPGSGQRLASELNALRFNAWQTIPFTVNPQLDNYISQLRLEERVNDNYLPPMDKLL